MAAPTYIGDQLQSMVGSSPLDSEPEGDGAGWFRFIQSALLGWVDAEHNTDGTHKLRGVVVTSSSLAVTYSSHGGKVVKAVTSSGDVTINLPPAATWKPGVTLTVVKPSESNQVVINPSGTETINGAAGALYLKHHSNYTILTSDGVSDWLATAQKPLTAKFASQPITPGTVINGVITNKNNPPIITEGTLLASVEITPSLATSVLQCVALVRAYHSSSGLVLALFKDGATDAVVADFCPNNNNTVMGVINHSFTPGSTSPVTLTLRGQLESGSGMVVGKAGSGSGYTLGGTIKSELTVVEHLVL